MKYRIYYLIFVLLTGCVSMSELSYTLPDTSELKIVRIEQRAAFSPNTVHEYEFRCSNGECFDTNNPEFAYQDGVANQWGAALIGAGGTLGGSVILGNAIRAGQEAIGAGLALSGNQTTVNNASVSGSKAYAGSKSFSFAAQRQGQSVKFAPHRVMPDPPVGPR